MHYSVLRLRNTRVAVVLVNRSQVQDDILIRRLQKQLAHPVMLVARDDSSWKGIKVNAQFQAAPFIHDLMMMDDIEWSEVPEPELPF